MIVSYKGKGGVPGGAIVLHREINAGRGIRNKGLVDDDVVTGMYVDSHFSVLVRCRPSAEKATCF